MYKHFRILLVDDQVSNLRLMERILNGAGYTQVRSLSDARQVLPVHSDFHPDLVILDLHMPHLDGYTVLRQITGRAAGTYLPVLVITADSSSGAMERALSAGARDFLIKPISPVEMLLRINNLLETRQMHQRLEMFNQTLQEQVAEQTRGLEQTQSEILERLALAAEFRDDNTGEHTQRVSLLSARIGEELGLPADTIKLLRLAAPLHDVGKIGVPDHILLKPGPLSPQEFEVIKSHTTIGARILSGGTFPLLQYAEEIALTHHENWDGTGYSPGLEGELIPLPGRIVAVADTFDALVSDRPYKRRWPVDQAVAEIRRLSGIRFDPQVVGAFLRVQQRLASEASETREESIGVNSPRPKLAELSLLTPREREVLELVAHGRTNSEIAQQLYVGEATVKTHVSRILQKLGLKDRTAAAVYRLRGERADATSE